MLPRATLCAVMRLPDHWVWDSWVADDGADYHLFFLMAPRALEDPSARHTGRTRRHAVSATSSSGTSAASASARPSRVRRPRDLDRIRCARQATVADVLHRAVHRGHHIFDQRVGSAVSDDLHHWRRSAPNPPCGSTAAGTRPSPTPRRPTTGPDLEGSSETWRDPVVLPTPTATAGTCSSPPAASRPAATTTASSPTHQPRPHSWTLGRRSATRRGVRPARSAAERRHHRASRPRLHLPPPGADARTDRRVGRVLHLVRALPRSGSGRGT
jgi:beta-fructofuranosidase